MAERARHAAPPEAPPLDPDAVRRSYRLERAKRRVRSRRRRASRWASFRFWLVVLGLLAASVFLSLTVLREVEQLFGL
jgi:hypothetical protein